MQVLIIYFIPLMVRVSASVRLECLIAMFFIRFILFVVKIRFTFNLLLSLALMFLFIAVIDFNFI